MFEARREAVAVAVATGILAMTSWSGSARGADASPSAASTAPAPAHPPDGAATRPAARSLQAILSEFQQTKARLGDFISPEVFADAKKRVEAAPKVIPTLKSLAGLADEMSSDPEGQQIAAQIQPQLQSLLLIFGDPDTKSAVEAQAKSSDAAVAAKAQAALLSAHWAQESNDPAARDKMVDEAIAMARNNPKSQRMLGLLLSMSEKQGLPREVGDRLTDAVGLIELPAAAELKAQIDDLKRLRKWEGQPLTIKGTTVDHKPFSSDQWKGKVILVDFWATWCGPCREELPRVKKIYADFHDKGLEILGVSNDYEADRLTAFLTADKAMPWPQLFDEKAAAQEKFNSISADFGVDLIPVMFLIDKKGICRTANGRAELETLIPKLLAE